MDFIKNALREFKHVVWPTREETKKYFAIVLAVLCAFGLYLFIVGNIFSEILFGLKNVVNPSAPTSIGDVQLPAGLEGLEGLEITPDNSADVIPGVTGEEIDLGASAEIVEENIEVDTGIVEEAAAVIEE